MQRHTSCVLATGKKKFFCFVFFLLLLLLRRKYDEVRVESLVEIKHTSLSLLFAISNVIDRISLSQRNFFFSLEKLLQLHENRKHLLSIRILLRRSSF